MGDGSVNLVARYLYKAVLHVLHKPAQTFDRSGLGSTQPLEPAHVLPVQAVGADDLLDTVTGRCELFGATVVEPVHAMRPAVSARVDRIDARLSLLKLFLREERFATLFKLADVVVHLLLGDAVSSDDRLLGLPAKAAPAGIGRIELVDALACDLDHEIADLLVTLVGKEQIHLILLGS